MNIRIAQLLSEKEAMDNERGQRAECFLGSQQKDVSGNAELFASEHPQTLQGFTSKSLPEASGTSGTSVVGWVIQEEKINRHSFPAWMTYMVKIMPRWRISVKLIK